MGLDSPSGSCAVPLDSELIIAAPVLLSNDGRQNVVRLSPANRARILPLGHDPCFLYTISYQA
jgi:hypothetical protein